MIAIPVGGLSMGFQAAGYATPKFMLPLGGFTVFDFFLEGFHAYRHSEDVVVTSRQEPDIFNFIADRLKAHDFRRFHVSRMREGQSMMSNIGQAISETAFSQRQPVTIAVADMLRPQFEMPERAKKTFIVDFGIKRGRRVEAKDGFLKAARLCHGLGCYHIGRAYDFVGVQDKSNAAWMRDAFNEKAMVATESLSLAGRLKLRGYSFTPRIIEENRYITMGRPQYYEALKATHEGAPDPGKPAP